MFIAFIAKILRKNIRMRIQEIGFKDKYKQGKYKIEISSLDKLITVYGDCIPFYLILNISDPLQFSHPLPRQSLFHLFSISFNIKVRSNFNLKFEMQFYFRKISFWHNSQEFINGILKF